MNENKDEYTKEPAATPSRRTPCAGPWLSAPSLSAACASATS